ncbi:transposase [Spirochaetota bacterium]
MSNKPRVCKPNLTYHVFSRCVDRKNLMKHKHMKELMISVINMALIKYKFELSTHIILNNHFHFIIKTVTDGASISIIMQFIKSQYARRYNSKMNRIGPFWNERFGDTIIENAKDPQFLFNWIILYIAYNAIRKGYVNDPRNYEYSSIKYYLMEDYEPSVKITRHEYFEKLGSTFAKRVNELLKVEEMYRKRLFPEYLFE